ncbi:MAG: hypothetical protein PVF26_08290 [Desulfobacterales bacterium]
MVIARSVVESFLLDFTNRVLRTRFHPRRLGHFAPRSFPAYGGKIQASRCAAGGR